MVQVAVPWAEEHVRFFGEWCQWAIRGRLEPVKKVAR